MLERVGLVVLEVVDRDGERKVESQERERWWPPEEEEAGSWFCKSLLDDAGNGLVTRSGTIGTDDALAWD